MTFKHILIGNVHTYKLQVCQQYILGTDTCFSLMFTPFFQILPTANLTPPPPVYTQRPQSASVFTDQAEVDKLMKTLTWYNRRATSSSEGNSVGSFER